MTGDEPATDSHNEQQDPLTAYLSEIFYDQTRAQRLPLTPAQVAEPDLDAGVPTVPVSTHIRFFKLTGTEASWRTLALAFESGKTVNLRPWYRCLGILREHGAKTAIAETYYVCLDHKSEIASFYSHLDRARRAHTVRLHFFDCDVPKREQFNLEDYAKHYLGYIVCRQGELPLVGRALLRPPKYVEVSTSIREDVNLLGQKLPVRGVPFMQQDARFAVCAHVAMWTLQYTAYRRGLNERRLIGEIVRENRPLQPRGSQGLTEQQVIDGLTGIGFRAQSMLTPDPVNHTMPEIALKELAPRLSPPAYELAETEATDTQRENIADFVVATLARQGDEQPATDEELAELGLTEQQWEEQENARARNIHEIQRALMDYFLRDWIDSRLPVYAALAEHALVVCGRSLGERPTYYVHDDQNGPYLKLMDLCHVSLPALLAQSGRFTDASAGTAESAPPRDRLTAATAHEQEMWEPTAQPPENARAVMMMFTATPYRLLLAPSAARRRAAEIIDPLHQITTRLKNADEARVVVTMMMGIDYKRQRRARAKVTSARQALTAYSGVQLAEWVTVVEGLTDSDDSLWDLVFDASSSNDTPLIQLARVGNRLMLADPLDDQIEEASLGRFTCKRILAPIRVGKASGREVPPEGDLDGAAW